MKRFFLVSLLSTSTAIGLGFLLQNKTGFLMLWGATWAWLTPPLILTLILSVASAYLLPHSRLQQIFLPWMSPYSDGEMRRRWLLMVVPWFALAWAVSNASYFNINGKVGEYADLADLKARFSNEKIIDLKQYQLDLDDALLKQESYGKLDTRYTVAYSALRLQDTTEAEFHLYPYWILYERNSKYVFPEEAELRAEMRLIWATLPQNLHHFWVETYTPLLQELLQPNTKKVSDIEQDKRIWAEMKQQVAGGYLGKGKPLFLHPLHFDPVAWRGLSKLLLLGFLVLAQLGLWVAVPKG